MQVKIFRAANLQAALEEIREQLGPNASVLRTRQCRDGWMGWLGRSYVEVTASSGEGQDDPTPSLGESLGELQSDPSVVLPPQRLVFSTRQPIDARQTDPRGLPQRLRFDASLADRSNADRGRLITDPLDRYRTDLIALGVAPRVADRWIRSTNGFVSNLGESHTQPWLEQLARSVAREIRFSGPIRLGPGDRCPRERRVVALIGPTGVGKTTTVAKLAAGFRIQSQRRVGLLTIDTFRIAAVQQLQAYAQIMDLPMSVVESADQMRSAIDRLGDVDVVLIDTAGRSPNGDLNIAELAELLRTAQPDETHLVISATSTAAVVESAIKGFSAASPTAAVLTKLDETPYTAGVLSALASSSDSAGIPISYVTNGQHVPDDISVATTAQLIDRLFPAEMGTTQTEAA